MNSVAKHTADVNRRLMWPDKASLDRGVIADYLLGVIDELMTEANQTNEPHFLMDGIITTEQNIAVYNVDSLAPFFGKARYVYTQDDSDSNFYRSPIDIVSPEDLTAFHSGGDPSVSATSNQPHTAQAVAFYYLVSAPGPANCAEFGPIPPRSAQYKLIYEPSVWRKGNRLDTGFRFEQFDEYVAALTARRCVPHCQWKGVEDTSARKSEIAAVLNQDIGSVANRSGLAFLWWKFRQRSDGAPKPTVVGFGRGRW